MNYVSTTNFKSLHYWVGLFVVQVFQCKLAFNANYLHLHSANIEFSQATSSIIIFLLASSQLLVLLIYFTTLICSSAQLNQIFASELLLMSFRGFLCKYLPIQISLLLYYLFILSIPSWLNSAFGFLLPAKQLYFRMHPSLSGDPLFNPSITEPIHLAHSFLLTLIQISLTKSLFDNNTLI